MKKKIFAGLMAAILMITFCAVVSATTYYVTANRLRIRNGPGSSHDVMGHLDQGQKVEVTNISNGWATIKLDHHYSQPDGYVAAKYLSRSKSASYKDKNSNNNDSGSVNYRNFHTVNYHVIVNPTNNYVNMRWEPSKSAQVRRIYYYGATLRVLSENGSWCQVMDESSGEVGYMVRSLLLRID